MTIDEMIAVLQAAKAGKQIQLQLPDGWTDLSDPSWDFNHNKYRVKPEPREWLVTADVLDSYHLKPHWLGVGNAIKVREVL